MLETQAPATDLDLISFLRAIPETAACPAWYLLLVASLGIYRFAEGQGLQRLPEPS